MTRFLSLLSTAAILIVTGCAGSGELADRETPSFDNYMPYSEQITPDYLRSHLEIFASDSLMGRNTGTEGETMAAQYLISHYREMGIEPMGTDGYLQPFVLNAEQTDSLVFNMYTVENSDTLSHHKSLVANGSPGEFIRLFGGTAPVNSEIIFGGFGVNDPQRGVNHVNPEQMKGKWVLLFADFPTVVNGDTLISPEITNNARIGNLFGIADVGGVLVVSADENSQFTRAAEVNAQLIDQPSNMRLKYLDNSESQGGFPKSYTQVSPKLAADILGLNSTRDLFTLRKDLADNISNFTPEATGYHLNYTPYSGTVEVQGENVISYIEGSDPILKNEVVVLMGHYDHIGLSMPDESGDMINNGADDNGSGSMALLTIAEALQNAKNDGVGLDRSVLILHVSAEEKGLLGSRYYSDHPVIPIEQTVTAFNTDMIGRSDTENVEAGTTDYFYLIGGEIISSGLDSLVTAANDETVQMRIDRKYNDLTDSNQFYRRSDHWNFGRLNVPFVFFFTGVHEDYHRPSDEVDKIEFEKYSRLVRMIYASTVKVANFDGRPQVDNEEFIDITRQLPR
ncbi:M28 family peptidase [Rhodohalobacter sp. 8-1]|uniref:M28 family peptidase n=1 Tax=Rhodohalobacter sp. 8-1 TaxID=3131972 RepID=UPI0030EC6710